MECKKKKRENKINGTKNNFLETKMKNDPTEAVDVPGYSFVDFFIHLMTIY